jgi:hypothetical protein
MVTAVEAYNRMKTFGMPEQSLGCKSLGRGDPGLPKKAGETSLHLEELGTGD